MQHSKRYERGEWLKTPYAGSDAKDPERAVMDLLEGYGVQQRQWTDHKGPNGRVAVTLRFQLNEKVYRISIETLDVARAEPRELRKQALRVIYWTLKPLLENALLFGGPDRLLLPFMEDDTGRTVYEQLQPYLSEQKFQAKHLLGYATRPALPAPGQQP